MTRHADHKQQRSWWRGAVAVVGLVALSGLVIVGLQEACACGPRLPLYQLWINELAQIAGLKAPFARPAL
jgi:hypothetical protein